MQHVNTYPVSSRAKILTPFLRYVERLPDFILDQVGIMLQASTQSFLLEGDPDIGLKHPNRLLSPRAEVRCVHRKTGFKALNNFGIDEIENSCVASLSFSGEREFTIRDIRKDGTHLE